MGWASGSELAADIIESIKQNVLHYDTRRNIYFDLISSFEQFDCDTLDECLDIDRAFDAAYHEVYPEWDDE